LRFQSLGLFPTIRCLLWVALHHQKERKRYDMITRLARTGIATGSAAKMGLVVKPGNSEMGKHFLMARTNLAMEDFILHQNERLREIDMGTGQTYHGDSAPG